MIENLTSSDIQKDALKRAEEEIKFMEKNKISPFFFTDEMYPSRLKECADSPAMLYTKGNANLNAEKVVSIVGSRRATAYGKKICEQMVEAFASYNALIVSGLAYGIDIAAHRAAIKNNLSTVGVLAHGLDNLYPAEHSNTAGKMLENGGLISEFMSQTKMNPEYFPRRNRIVAGMSEATIVMEATYKSGALITAEIANSYDREVFAVPGNLDEPPSEGCNLLIKANKAMGLHTLVLLDIKYDLQKFMTINEAIKILLDIEEKRKEHIFTKETLCIGCARLGSETRAIKAGTAEQILKCDFGAPLHCLLVPGTMHFMEEEAVEMWK